LAARQSAPLQTIQSIDIIRLPRGSIIFIRAQYLEALKSSPRRPARIWALFRLECGRKKVTVSKKP
jgi:hypothetical protein